MRPPRNDFRIKVNGSTDIFRYQTKPNLAGFSYGLDYELEQARLYAGLSASEWGSLGGSQIWVDEGGFCKADYLVMYRVNQRLGAVSKDIQDRHQEAEMRKARLKGKR